MRRRPLFASLALIREEDRHVWGTCAEAEGFFGEPECESYELRGWVPEPAGASADGWLGSRVWLVPEDPGADAWLLSDVEAAPVPGGVVVTGGDDYLGPPEEYRGPVRLHDGVPPSP